MRLFQYFTIAALATRTTVSASFTGNTTCYNIDGSVSGVSYRCNNATTGHTTCCQPEAVCYSNGVCKTDNEGYEDYQRVGCTDNTWQDPACLRQCENYASGSTAGIRPCDGIDAGNHYCCDDGSEGIGSYACCDNSSDVFILGSSIPSVVALMPLSQTSTSTTASATGTQSSSAPAGSSSSSSSSSATSSETAVGLGVGLGVGIPVSVAVAGLIWFFTWRARRKDHQRRGAAIESSYDGGSGQSGGVAGMASIQGYSQVPQHQQPGLHAAADGLPKYEVDGGPPPQEMQAPLQPAELPGTLRTELP